MKIWFKQFESHGKQVLVEKTEHDELDQIGILIRWQGDIECIGEMQSNIWFLFNDDNYKEIEQIRNERFDNIEQINVDTVINETLKAMSLEDR
ncbi:hypothetical protein [Xenorhabdus bovienii]|uniref:hypothetical protein n=1 Tax=Xenorhabdus bovienii TaxID=40576 RepID=UPI003DA53FD3